jgi:hypothetical protein
LATTLQSSPVAIASAHDDQGLVRKDIRTIRELGLPELKTLLRLNNLPITGLKIVLQNRAIDALQFGI